MKKSYIRWILAIIITLTAAVYQRMTGPTYPLRGKVAAGAHEISYKLSRSHGGSGDQPISIAFTDTSYTASLVYKRYKVEENWTKLPMQLELRGASAGRQGAFDTLWDEPDLGKPLALEHRLVHVLIPRAVAALAAQSVDHDRSARFSCCDVEQDFPTLQGEGPFDCVERRIQCKRHCRVGRVELQVNRLRLERQSHCEQTDDESHDAPFLAAGA